MAKIDTPFVLYEIRDNILIATYKKGVKIDLDIARKIVSDRRTVMGNKSMPVMVLNQGVISMDKEARDYLSSPDANKGLIAGAIISDSVFTSILSNFFLSVSKPNIPAKMFTSQEQAMKWLQKFNS